MPTGSYRRFGEAYILHLQDEAEHTDILGPGSLHSSGLRRLLTLRKLDSTVETYVHAPMHFDYEVFWDRLASHLPPSWFVNCPNYRLMRSEIML